MWKNEKEFVTYFMSKLKAAGVDCSRIETPATGVGMPDLWIQAAGDDYFIEMKLVKHDLPAAIDMEYASEVIPWRPGQVAWGVRYSLNHTIRHPEGNVRMVKHSWTFVGMNDGVIAIRMGKVYSNNLIAYNDKCVHTWSKKEFSKLNVLKFLIDNTYTKITGQ